MYIKDGSNIDYCSKKSVDNLYMWGWLGNKVEKSKDYENITNGEMINVYDKLKDIDEKYVTDWCMGEHSCEICGDFQFNGSIKIAHNNKIFCCPNGVWHYIREHFYIPEREVVDAIKYGKILIPTFSLDRSYFVRNN